MPANHNRQSGGGCSARPDRPRLRLTTHVRLGALEGERAKRGPPAPIFSDM